MPKYTEEELIAFRDNGKAPEGVDLKAFSDMIANVKDILEKRMAEKHISINDSNLNHTVPSDGSKFTFRRRSSRHEARPHFKKNFRKHEPHAVQPDAEGWVTMKNTRKSFTSGGAAEESRDEFRKVVKNEVVKVKPNTKTIGTRAAANTTEAVAEKTALNFNAFSALGSDEEEEEDEEDDDEDEEEEKEEKEEKENDAEEKSEAKNDDQ